MEFIEHKLLTCPKCGTNNNFDVYKSVNITDDFLKREDVLTNKIFRYKCANCNLVTTIYYPFLYHDKNKKFVIQFDPKNIFDDSLGIKDMDVFNDYTCRIVKKSYELVDKILILEKFDDRVMEVLKEFVIASSNASNVLKLAFAKTKDDSYEFLCINSNDEVIGLIPFTEDLYDMIYDKFYDKLKDLNPYIVDRDFAIKFLNEVEI